ncbi:MAG: metallophosphoesterase [Deltaproteobacteria bacterium]|nr:metallophosphoesterase [Deltaproteobacteria bacterium]
MNINRRDFLKLAGLGGVVFVSGLGSLAGPANAARSTEDDFYFIQLSDTHVGFTGPAVNPEAPEMLKKVITIVNGLAQQPDFVFFSGDLTHVTDDDQERKTRLALFKNTAKGLKVKDVKFMPGEHDSGLDDAAAYKEFFGETHYVFDHKGVHFIVLDNATDPMASVGESQLKWLSDDLKQLKKDARIIILTHRPLFDLYPSWDWHTRDGSKVMELLMPYSNVIVFYGHIHQEHHHVTGHIAHHAAKGLMFPLPAPGSVPKRAPIPWNAAQPYKGLGFRNIEPKVKPVRFDITELGVKGEKI